MAARPLIDRLDLAVATGFGLGLAPVASGTFGSLLGIPLGLACLRLPLWGHVAAALFLSFLAIPVCDRAERLFGKKDDGRIVADEFMTFPIGLVGLPLLSLPVPQAAALLAICFVTARACDIVKPWPARQIQELPGGAGVLLDDFFASLYALALNHLLLWFLHGHVAFFQ